MNTRGKHSVRIERWYHTQLVHCVDVVGLQYNTTISLCCLGVKSLSPPLAGCGRSDWNERYDLDMLPADAEAICESCEFDRWSTVGHSAGPSVAFAYALHYPSRFMGVIGVVDGKIVDDHDWSAAYEGRFQTIEGTTAARFFTPTLRSTDRAMPAGRLTAGALRRSTSLPTSRSPGSSSTRRTTFALTVRRSRCAAHPTGSLRGDRGHGTHSLADPRGTAPAGPV